MSITLAPAAAPARRLPIQAGSFGRTGSADLARAAAARSTGAASASNQPQASGAAPLLSWAAARPSYERTATTGTVAVAGSSTTSASARVSVTASGAYTFSAASSYSWTGKRPTVRLEAVDGSGRVVKTSSTDRLVLSRTDTARIGSGEITFRLNVTAARGSQAWLTSYRLDAQQNLSPLPASSGNRDMDAILAGGPHWWHDTGSVAAVSATPVTDTVRQIAGARTTLRYSFLAGSESYLTAADKSGFAAMNNGQKQAVVSALDYLSTLINVEFVEDAAADIAFGTNQQVNSAGYAHYPLGNGGNPSLLMLDNLTDAGQATNTASELQDRSSYAWYTLVHELGHAMGLKHPGAYNAGGGTPSGPFLSSGKDHRGTSVMSYKDAPASLKLSVNGSETGYSWSGSSLTPQTLKSLDIAALQYLYGANTDTAAATVSVADGYSRFETLWAPKGATVDASATTRSNVFDFRAGNYSSIALQTPADQVTALKGQFIAKGVSATRAGEYAQTMVAGTPALKGKIFDGRNTLGLAWGSRYTSVTGGSGADRFYAGTYSTSIAGGDGLDTLYLQGSTKDWTVGSGAAGVTTYTHTRTQAVISARGIEKVAYYKATAAAV